MHSPQEGFGASSLLRRCFCRLQNRFWVVEIDNTHTSIAAFWAGEVHIPNNIAETTQQGNLEA